MAIIYSVKYSDQTVDPVNKKPFTISPGAWDTTTSLTIPGQAAALYGEHIAENFLYLLENFASSTAPVNPTVGQIWYDSTQKMVRVLTLITTAGNGVKSYTWSPVGGPYVATTPPTDKGSLWYDTSDANSALWQLKIYNTGQAAWMSVADQYVRKSGDTMSGHLASASISAGFISNRHTAPKPEGLFPTSAMGPILQSVGNANVLIPSVAAGGNAGFVVSASEEQDASMYNISKIAFQVANSGEVIVYRNQLNMNGNKVVNVANGTLAADAVNFGQLSGINTSLGNQVTDLQNNKVNRVGDTMTGALTISTVGIGQGSGSFAGQGLFALVVNGTGTNSGGILVNAKDDNGDQNGIEIVNNYGSGGATQSMFTVKSFNGNTAIAGATTIAKSLAVGTTFSVGSTAYFAGAATMDIAQTSIVNARHLVTKEYVDTKIAGLASTEVFSRVNPASARNGDILLNGALIYIYNNGWRQVFPSQWAD